MTSGRPWHEDRGFVRALQFRWLSRLYDPVVRMLRVDGLRGRMVDQMRVEPGERILDVGCGTGTLLLAIKAAQPGADVVGVYPDPDILSIAREKASQAGVEVELEVGFANRLPHADGDFRDEEFDPSRGPRSEIAGYLQPGR